MSINYMKIETKIVKYFAELNIDLIQELSMANGIGTYNKMKES